MEFTCLLRSERHQCRGILELSRVVFLLIFFTFLYKQKLFFGIFKLKSFQMSDKIVELPHPQNTTNPFILIIISVCLDASRVNIFISLVPDRLEHSRAVLRLRMFLTVVASKRFRVASIFLMKTALATTTACSKLREKLL